MTMTFTDHIRLQFTDMFGMIKNIAVPLHASGHVLGLLHIQSRLLGTHHTETAPLCHAAVSTEEWKMYEDPASNTALLPLLLRSHLKTQDQYCTDSP